MLIQLQNSVITRSRSFKVTAVGRPTIESPYATSYVHVAYILSSCTVSKISRTIDHILAVDRKCTSLFNTLDGSGVNSRIQDREIGPDETRDIVLSEDAKRNSIP